MRKISLKFLFSLLLVGLAACYYDSEEDLFPEINNDCILENLSFSNDIVPILDNNCWSCHSNSQAASFGGNIKLEEYVDIVQNINALLGSINHDPSYSAMPKNGGKIPSCDIQKMEKWNTDGQPNN